MYSRLFFTVTILTLPYHRAAKEAVLAQRAKDKEKKKKGGFFGFGGKAVTKEEEEVDAEQDHDDREEVRSAV